jgi:hypothetical protein
MASQTDNNDILVSNYGPISSFSKLNTLPNICYAHELHTTMPEPPSLKCLCVRMRVTYIHYVQRPVVTIS